ncbi:MAG: Ldh family oxidoreductase [Spirochaetales bacterium]|jgi:LDH2 family malate/lactate/ureidoglycolate dehydrogenase|nr:Ldh family oxidoreductase [Spirochaetales bacterium]
MNQKQDFLIFREERLREWCTGVLKKCCAVTDDYAAAVSGALVSANLRGVDTHGVNLLQYYVRRFKNISHTDIRVTAEMPAFCHIDGGAHMGPAVSVFAMDRAIEKAAACGVGMALAENSSHFGATGYYTCQAARKGYIGFATTVAYKTMTPWGGLENFIGNNPFSFAFPWREFPIMLDISNSVTARNKIFNYAREGWALPEGWATDSEGVPTTDARKAIEGFLQPIAGYKGVGIAMMFEIIVGTLAHGHYATSIKPNADPTGAQNVSHLFMAIKPDCFMTKKEIDETLEKFVTAFRAVKRRKDVGELLLPGEIEYNREQERKKAGIPLSPALVAELNKFASESGAHALLEDVC